MLKIWKTNRVTSEVHAESRMYSMCVKKIKGYVLEPNSIVQKALIDDIINALDDFEVSMFTYSTK